MKVRLGSIAFINSLPVDLGLVNGSVKCDAQIFQEVPARLNEMLSSECLDISPVSAFWYASRAQDLILLPELSISSESGVQSVLLFSKLPWKELGDAEIALTPQGRTTPALLHILCKKIHGFEPHTRVLPEGAALPPGAEAALLIGDEALKARSRYESMGWHSTDLAQEWRAWTGKPFVFALWAVRRSFYATHPETVVEIHRALLESKRWGQANLSLVMAAARERSGLSDEIITAYFGRLNHGFSAQTREGLLLFLGYCRELGLLEAVPDLEMILPKTGQLAAGAAS